MSIIDYFCVPISLSFKAGLSAKFLLMKTDIHKYDFTRQLVLK